MKIWIDLANSPQVLFFKPLIRALKARGHTVTITTRPYAQTVPLAGQVGLQHQPIGAHGGTGMAGLAIRNFERAFALRRWAAGRQFDLALSHNSYSQILAARLMRVPSVTLMDYEYQPLNHLAFRLAGKVVVPQVFPEAMLEKFGAAGKSARYAGLKEQVYLDTFSPQKDFLVREGFPREKALVVIRPPAAWTAYHRFENDLFDEMLARLSSQASAFNLFLPRLPEQLASIRTLPGINPARKVYDGPNLLYHADLVISGGGTMNREAAVLGTPAYTLFAGKMPAVDRTLIDQGRMTCIQSEADLKTLAVTKKPGVERRLRGESLVSDLLKLILPAGG